MKPRDKNAKIRLPKLYKKLLLVAIVIGPIWWLVFTADGQRRSDMVLLTLLGEEHFNLNLEALDSRVSEAEIMELYPNIKWQCQDQKTAFGERHCFGEIGSFNNLPADYATIFFHNGGINAVKVGYHHKHHSQLGIDLKHQLGPPLSQVAATAEIPQPDLIVQWRTDSGHVITKKRLEKGEEAALLWLSTKQMSYSSN
jgi:hypothetical protein